MVSFLVRLMGVFMAVVGGVVVRVLRVSGVVVFRMLMMLRGLLFMSVLVVFMVADVIVDVVVLPGVVQPAYVPFPFMVLVGLGVLHVGELVMLSWGGMSRLRVMHRLLWSRELLMVRLVGHLVRGVNGENFSDVGVLLRSGVRCGCVGLSVGHMFMVLFFLEHCFQL